jgi:DNA-binding NarL/FixJ family response regulator
MAVRMERSGMEGIRVVLADDHGLVRAGIRALLERLKLVSVLGEASNGREALALMKSLSPDVVLMDATMPELNGIDATRRAALEFPGVKIIVLSVHSAEDVVMRALHAGASGYMLKDSTPRELDLALKVVMRGEAYLSPSISRHLLGRYTAKAGPGGNPLDLLSPRQREIAQLIGEGNTTKEIAYMLELSPKTVEAHRAQLMARLCIRDVPGLVRWGIRTGLVEAGS